MELYLLRHGLAVERTVGLKDRERTLTPKGRKKTAALAARLKALKISFDLILASPFVRARETAEMVAAKTKPKGALALSGHLMPGGNLKLVLKELQDNAGKKSVLLVGHEPDLSQLVSLLVTGKAGLKLDLKKGGLCKLDIEDFSSLPCATLLWLAPSKLFEC
jgi:phosphohistidine phosphatase